MFFNLSSLQWSHTSDHGPCLPSQEEGGKRPKRHYTRGRLNQRKRGNCAVTCRDKEIETDMRHVLHGRERIRTTRLLVVFNYYSEGGGLKLDLVRLPLSILECVVMVSSMVVSCSRVALLLHNCQHGILVWMSCLYQQSC